MKKRLSCLLLSILMIALCFTGCAEKTSAEVLEKIGEESSDGAVMLSMYLLSEEAVSEEQELAMEAAVNAITEKEFKDYRGEDRKLSFTLPRNSVVLIRIR